MKRNAIVLVSLLFLSLSIFQAQAQKRKSKPKSSGVLRASPFFRQLYAEETLPEIKDFAFVIYLDKDQKTKITVQKTEDSESLNAAQLSEFFTKLSQPKNSLEPIIIIKADASLKFESVIKIIQAARVSEKSRIKVEIPNEDTHFYVFIPRKMSQSALFDGKPYPLELVASLNNELKIQLNNQDEGSLYDTAKLKNHLTEIFKTRDANGVFRECTNETEKTVFVKAPLSVKFADVIKLINALKEVYATPIGLQVDDLP